MRYNKRGYVLSEFIKGLIKEERIAQAKIELEITRLYKQGKIGYTLSQQRISNHLNGKPSPHEDIENVFRMAIKSLIGNGMYQEEKSRYKKREKEKKKQQTENKKYIRLNEVMKRKASMSEEELFDCEMLTLQCEEQTVLDFLHNMSENVKEYWKNILPWFHKFPYFVKEVLFLWAGIDREEKDLMILMKEFELLNSSSGLTDMFYHFTNEQLTMLTQILKYMSQTEQNVFEDCDYCEMQKIMKNNFPEEQEIRGSLYVGETENEKRILECYRISKIEADEYILFLCILACMTKIDWLLIFEMCIFYYTEKGEKTKQWLGNLVTQDEEEILHSLNCMRDDEEEIFQS